MAKAKPFSDEDEKTTIESETQWGDEASTTVEEQEALASDAPAALPRRAQVITNVTNTNASALEESTVDDQHNPMLPATATTRLVVTAGNDTGLEQAIDVGKAYTIGRGLDNDLVLTDIAVSRKHFDLRNDGGSWVIVDRGSGNGTVVNGNVEDNPFMLANGDVIEIGNTTFRFEAPESPRAFSPENEFDSEEEMSTVAGKPMHHVTPLRPKTLPPPAPLRPRAMTQPPAYPVASQSMPMATPPQPQPVGTPGPLPAATLPMPIHLSAPVYATSYPQATEIPPHSVHAQMLVIQNQQKRGDLATAHVPPVVYGKSASPQRFTGALALAKRTKYLMVLGALAVVATIVTIVVVHGDDQGDERKPRPKKAVAVTPVPPAVTPIEEPPPPEPVKSPPSKPEPSPPEPPRPEPPRPEPPKQAQKDPPSRQETKHVDRESRSSKRSEERRVAIATPPPDQTEKIDSLYRDKKFGEAAGIANAAARANPDPDESSALKIKAQRLKALAVAYNSGMAPAAKATDAFDELVAATTYDQNLGGRFGSEISQRLAAVAPKAAMSFAGAHSYDKAHTAVQKAEALGAGGDKNVQLVKNKLEGAAQALYQDAMSDTDPKSAKDKLRQVRLMVDAKSPWYQKATTKLAN